MENASTPFEKMPAKKRFIVPFYSGCLTPALWLIMIILTFMLPEAEFEYQFQKKTRAAYSRLINICSFADINGTCIIRRFKNDGL